MRHLGGRVSREASRRRLAGPPVPGDWFATISDRRTARRVVGLLRCCFDEYAYAIATAHARSIWMRSPCKDAPNPRCKVILQYPSLLQDGGASLQSLHWAGLTVLCRKLLMPTPTVVLLILGACYIKLVSFRFCILGFCPLQVYHCGILRVSALRIAEAAATGWGRGGMRRPTGGASCHSSSFWAWWGEGPRLLVV